MRGEGREGKMENAADIVLAEPARGRRGCREGGDGREKHAGSVSLALLYHSHHPALNPGQAQRKKRASQQLGLSPANLEEVQADSSLLVESWILAPAR